MVKPMTLEEIIYQLRDIRDDLDDLYDPDYDGYSPIRDVLFRLETTIYQLKRLKVKGDDDAIT